MNFKLKVLEEILYREKKSYSCSRKFFSVHLKLILKSFSETSANHSRKKIFSHRKTSQTLSELLQNFSKTFQKVIQNFLENKNISTHNFFRKFSLHTLSSPKTFQTFSRKVFHNSKPILSPYSCRTAVFFFLFASSSPTYLLVHPTVLLNGHDGKVTDVFPKVVGAPLESSKKFFEEMIVKFMGKFGRREVFLTKLVWFHSVNRAEEVVSVSEKFSVKPGRLSMKFSAFS